MEKLRMYNPVKKEEEKEPLKTPQLTIRGKLLLAVEETGERLATLCNFAAGIYPSNARNRLTDEGYRVDWAEWAEDGTFMYLIEDVEG